LGFIERFHKKHQERIVGLDILRTIAILIVVYGHGSILVPVKNRELYMSYNFIKMDGVSIILC